MQKLINLQDKFQKNDCKFEPLLLEYEKVICREAEMAIKFNLVDKLFMIWKQQLQTNEDLKTVLLNAIGSFNLMSLVYLHELPSTTTTFHIIQLEHCICLKRSGKALPSRQIHAILLNKIYSALSDIHRYYNKKLDDENDTESHYSLSALHYFYFDGKALNQLGMFYQYEAIKRPSNKLQNGLNTFYFYLFAYLTPYHFKKSQENLQHFIKVFLGLIVVDIHPLSKLLFFLFKVYAKQQVDLKDTDDLLLDSMDSDTQNMVFKCCVGLFDMLDDKQCSLHAILKLFIKFHSNNQILVNFINFVMSYTEEVKEALSSDNLKVYSHLFSCLKTV